MNDEQIKVLQDELMEIQTYLKDTARFFQLSPKGPAFARWANTIGTTRLLLDVFSDDWAERTLKGEPGDETPNVTTANRNDVDGKTLPRPLCRDHSDDTGCM